MAAAPSQFGAATVPGLNPITAQVPSFALQSLQAQRQAQIAQALMGEGAAPIDYDNRGRISWTQGLAKMLQAYQGSKLGNDAIKQQAALQTQGMQAMAPMYGFGGGAPAQASPQMASQAAMGAGATQGSVGPTNSNAALAAALQTQGGGQPPAQGQSGPLNPFGAPPMLAWLASQGDPAALEQLKTFGSNATLTPEIKNYQWSDITPVQAKAMALAKAQKEAQISHTPGEFTTNALTGQNAFYPKVPDYAQPSAMPGPTGFVGRVAPVNGAIQTAAATTGATAGADASARLPYQTTTVLDESGNPTLTTMGGIGIGGGAPRAPGPVQQPPMQGAPAVAPAAPAAPMQPQLTRRTGLSATTTNLVGQGNDLLKTAQSAQANNQQVYSYLDEMQNLVNGGAKFGPGTADAARWKALANNFGIDITGAQTNQDVMHKLAASLAGSNSPRSDADLANWQARYPSGELTNQAITELIPLLRRQAQVQDARANVLTRNAQTGMDKLPDLANKFNQIASPAIVSEGSALARASQQGPQAVQQFMQQYRAHYPDWQSRLGKIKQLDGWGAF